jgi:hypothetical protein
MQSSATNPAGLKFIGGERQMKCDWHGVLDSFENGFTAKIIIQRLTEIP